MKEIIDTVGFIKVQMSALWKMSREGEGKAKTETTFAKHISEKGLLSRIYKEIFKMILLKIGKKSEDT